MAARGRLTNHYARAVWILRAPRKRYCARKGRRKWSMLALHREKKKHFYGAKIRILSVIAYCSLCFSFFSSFDDLFERKSYGTTHRVFLFWRIFFGLRETKLIILLCFLGTYRTTICEIFFFEYISCLFIRGEKKYKNLRMLETGGRGRLTRKWINLSLSVR